MGIVFTAEIILWIQIDFARFSDSTLIDKHFDYFDWNQLDIGPIVILMQIVGRTVPIQSEIEIELEMFWTMKMLRRRIVILTWV